MNDGSGGKHGGGGGAWSVGEEVSQCGSGLYLTVVSHGSSYLQVFSVTITNWNSN